VRKGVREATETISALCELNVLVVEDDAQLARLALRQLKGAGCEGTAAYSVSGALELLDDLGPDVLLIDVHLGGSRQTGIDFLGIARERGCEALALVITADGSKQQLFRAALAGADDFVVKGSGTSVVDAIARVLDRDAAWRRDGRSSSPNLDMGYFRSTRITLKEKELLEAWVERGCPPPELFAHAIGRRPDWVRHVFQKLYQKLKLDGVSELAHVATTAAMINTPPRGVRSAR
jgi:CheY-like chemotaxis protein